MKQTGKKHETEFWILIFDFTSLQDDILNSGLELFEAPFEPSLPDNKNKRQSNIFYKEMK